MAGAVVEVKYFNSFVLKKTVLTASPKKIIWNGSFGIPKDLGGYPRTILTSLTLNDNNWIIEEARIRGGYNNTSTDYGAKAYLVEEEPNAVTRGNSLIYSGIFNSRTGVNNTNVFSVAEDITKSADPSNGSIQKLYAEDTNLIIFQERKVSKALIDKDAIYSAEGNAAVTSSLETIGVIQPYAGKYGISKNPESFAVYGFNKYFSDKNNNVMMRLGQSGVDEISRFGMIDYFRDQLGIDTLGSTGKILGGWDIYNNQYVVSLQGNIVTSNTLSFDEVKLGWTSFYDYTPDQMFSLGNDFYTLHKADGAATGFAVNDYALYKHYSSTASRGNFYGVNYRSAVTFILNRQPTTSKNFKTIGYEGDSGWQLSVLVSDGTGDGLRPGATQWVTTNDEAALVPSLIEGEYVLFNASGTSNAASTNTVVVVNGVLGSIPVGASVTGVGVADGTTVVSYVIATKTLTVSANLAIAANVGLSFDMSVPRSGYQAAFATTSPPFSRYNAGFNLKENRYVTNLVNNSQAAIGEILFGLEISGVKAFYVTGTLATDLTTNPGGDKQLFSVMSDYVLNNGY